MEPRRAARAARVRVTAPLALAAVAAATAATGAGALTLRHPGVQPRAATVRTAPASPAAESIALPPPPPAAASAPQRRSTTPAGERAAVPPVVTRVPRPHRLVEATVLVTAAHPLSRHQVRAIRRLPGVRAVEAVAAGRARVDHHPAQVLGVRPASFRAWTPSLTARSQPLWQSIARGELTASFDMGHQARLPLGGTVPVRGARTVPIRIGAFASVGMGGVDAVVDAQRAHELGLLPDTGLVVSAPHADVTSLRDALRSVAGAQAHVALLRQLVVIRDAGEFLTRAQIRTVLEAAASRVGKPYVWGATGPDAFDCSGLVQWSFARAGIRMPRVSQQQWYAGPHVPYSAARPGDLLFWHYDPTDRGDIDHVAIYAGNGMMLVAPHTGAYVEYVPVPLNQFAGVVRVDPATAAQIG